MHVVSHSQLQNMDKQQREKDVVLCAKCGRQEKEENSLIVAYDTCESVTKCERWLAEKCSVSDVDSEYSSHASISSASVSQCQTDCSCDDAESSAVQLLKPTDLSKSVSAILTYLHEWILASYLF